jgi:hypothetical protein
MRSPAPALAWHLWRRHRIGLSALAALGVSLHFLVGVPIAAGVHPTDFWAWTLWPLVIALGYIVIVFSFARDADLALPASAFPARLFALPVPTRSLVVWPLLFGTAAVLAVWTSWNLGFHWAGKVRFTPMPWWPGLLVAAILAWMQAALWLPVPAAWVRIVGLLAGWTIIGAGSVTAFRYDLPEWAISAGLGLALLAAYAVAFVGVRRARHGDLPNWSWWVRLVDGVTHLLWGRRRTFASPGEALVWIQERRLRGSTIPALLAFFLVPTLSLPWSEWAFAVLAPLPGHSGLAAAVGALSIPGLLLLYLLVIPPLLATLGGNQLGTLSLGGSTSAISPFLATRPVDTATLVFAKLRQAGRGTLTIWAFLLPVALGWFLLGRRYARAAESDFVRHWGPGGAAGLLALLIVALVGLTWTQTVKGLWAGLTGRLWVAAANVLLTLTLGMAAVIVGERLKEHPEWRETCFVVASWLAGAIVILKVVAAGWVLRVVSRRALMPARFPVILVAGWVAVVVGLTGLLCALVSSEWVPPHLLALGAVLFVPLTRVAAAPLAVEWNRHR